MIPKPIQNLDPFRVPDPNDIGHVVRHQVYDQFGNPTLFEGVLIGHGTTQRDEHSHPLGQSAKAGQRCFACRWYEAYIYHVTKLLGGDLDARFMVATVGGTSVPGERTYYRSHATSSGFEVVELLTIRKTGSEPYMATSAARALAQAAEVDDVIREAYINRAVV